MALPVTISDWQMLPTVMSEAPQHHEAAIFFTAVGIAMRRAWNKADFIDLCSHTYDSVEKMIADSPAVGMFGHRCTDKQSCTLNEHHLGKCRQ